MLLKPDWIYGRPYPIIKGKNSSLRRLSKVQKWLLLERTGGSNIPTFKNIIIQVEVYFIGEPCDIQDKAGCPPIALLIPSQIRNVSLFHLTIMPHSDAFCAETKANLHYRFSRQSWLRPASVVLIVVHFFLVFMKLLPVLTLASSVWTVVLSWCFFARLSQTFLVSSDCLTTQ
jgi:hypothetical protein